MGDGGRWGGFDVVRVVAALAVVVSHALHLAGVGEPMVAAWRGSNWNLGGAAVAVFFVTSGFLVTRSWVADPHLGRFAVRRVARIWPALIVVMVLTALVIGTAVTAAPPAVYLTHPETWRYLLWNLLLLPAFYLPWVFHTNPDAVVNGSVWSLPLEVGWYVLLALFGAAGLLRRTWTIAAVTGVVVVAAWAQDLGVFHAPLAGGVLGPFMLPMGALFMLGALAARVRLPRSPWLAAAALVALVVSRGLPVSGLAYVGIAYAVIVVGTSQRGGWVHRWGDPSYGIFLWGWPVTQILVQAGVTDLPVLLPAALALSVVAGYASWHLVERGALRRARRFLTGARPARQPVDAAPSVR